MTMLPMHVRANLLWKAMKWRLRMWWVSPSGTTHAELPPLRPTLLLDRMGIYLYQAVFQRIRTQLFPYSSREAQWLSIETESDQAQRLCERVVFMRSKETRSLYGSARDFPEFLRRQSDGLLLNGATYYRISWPPIPEVSKDEDSDTSSTPVVVLPHLVPIRAENIQPIRGRGAVRSFRVATAPAAHRQQSGRLRRKRTPEVLLSEDLVVFMARKLDRRTIPLVDYVDDYWRERYSMIAASLSTHALAYPQDQRPRVESARFRRGGTASLLREMRLACLRTYDRAGCSLMEQISVWSPGPNPFTDYYLAWQHIRVRKDLMQLRLSLLDQFATQVLEPILIKNGLGGHVQLRLHGYLSESELDSLFSQYLDKKISLEDLWKQSNRDAAHPSG